MGDIILRCVAPMIFSGRYFLQILRGAAPASYNPSFGYTCINGMFIQTRRHNSNTKNLYF